MSSLNEALEQLKEYLKLSKDLGQLLLGDNSLINLYNADTHRLHGKVDTLGANTGRCTHSNPNITQISKDKEFRELMCVPEGKLLVDVDADALILVHIKQIELGGTPSV
jgi:DNA polymerase I domain protein